MRKPALKPEMKLGAEPKKVVLLGGLLVVAGIVYFINSSDTPSPAGAPASVPTRPNIASPAAPGTRNSPPLPSIARSGAATRRGGSLQEFRPTLKPKDPIDPSRIDPTLRLNLLAKLRSVTIEGSVRSLFDFSAAPAPVKTELPKVNPIHPDGEKTAFIGPVQEKPKAEPKPPPPPPIPLKFYGFTSPVRAGVKRAFFLEGEDIFVAGEGELIKNRYKVVRIGVNSAVVEDTDNKHEQTLPLEPEQVTS
jgi:hypothetical protein